MFPFAVNGLLTVVSIVIILYGRNIPILLRLTVGFFMIAILMIILPITANGFGCYPSIDLAADCSDTTGFFLCILILFIFSIFSGNLQASVFGLGG